MKREKYPGMCFAADCYALALVPSVLCAEHLDKLPGPMRDESEPEMLDRETDDFEPDGDYCECGAFHGEDEFSCGICSCCGLLVDINSEPV